MTQWEQQQFDEFRHMVENSPTLNISKKRVFERMLDEMLRLWNAKDIINFCYGKDNHRYD